MYRSHGFFRCVLPVLFALPVFIITLGVRDVTPAIAQGIGIGLYTDASGSSCNFSGDATGLVSTYVVVKPDAGGVRGVRFAAPIPECFKATYVTETPGEGLIVIGDSQAGISITSGVCEFTPVMVLEIMYMRAGGTTPCCEFPLIPEPNVTTSLEAVNCAYETITMASSPSHFNADESCPCTGDTSPLPPTNPFPFNGSTAQSVYSMLRWDATDFDDDLANYDVYLGHDADPPLVAATVTEQTYQPATLDPVSTYFWRIVARDAKGHETSGPTWSFATRLTNSPPNAPMNPAPEHQSTAIPISPTLSWFASDVEGDSLTYDVSFGTSSPPPPVASNLLVAAYQPPSLNYETTYYWQVVARDAPTGGTAGPVWSFTTRPENFPPATPSTPYPVNGSINQAVSQTLTWQCVDPDGNPLTFDVYFGTAPAPPLVASGQTSKSYPVGTLPFATTHYWKIVVHDTHGAEIAGPVWSFTTRPENLPPIVPHTPTPGSGATHVAINGYLIWISSDPDGDDVTYDLYLGTNASPPLLASDRTSRLFYPPGLVGGTYYYWKVVARDSHGAETVGPTWTFTTRANSPPVFSGWYSPGDGAVNQSVLPRLEWQATDPDGHAREYDIYFGTDPTPPLYKTDQTGWSYYFWQPVEFHTQYYWRIVARDEGGLEASSPTLTFTTGGNHPPVVTWDSPSPADKGDSSLNPVLWWISHDPDGQATTDSLFFGTAEPLPLIASGLTSEGAHQYSPGLLHAGTKYYWRVVTSDGEYTATGRTWSFTALGPGDVTNDGVISLDDADCALRLYTQWGSPGCAVDGSGSRADVNCDQEITPRDARCIHKNVLDGSCAFCEGAPAATATTQRFAPVITKDAAWVEWDTLIVQLSVSGVPSMQSFGFRSLHFPEMKLIRAVRYGISGSPSVLAVGGIPGVTTHHNDRVAGYWLDEADASSSVGFIELRYYLPTRQVTTVTYLQFVDDLEGAAELVITDDQVPVLFSSFSATPVAGGVDVRWQLVSDEAMNRYSLYRADAGTTLGNVIAQGRVASTMGSYLDRTAEAGKTYRYELAIETMDGDVFRSPAAMATIPAMQLALHQNHPNPFNPQTTIRYDLPGSGSARVKLWILDIEGRIVRTLVDEDRLGGSHEAVWNGTNNAGNPVSSGVYFYVLDVDRERRTRKLVLLK